MKKHLSFLSLLSLLPSAGHACTVCFGGADGDLIRGFTWGIALLLVLPFAMIAGFTTVIVRAIKKNKTHE